jgi:hypothetical protein
MPTPMYNMNPKCALRMPRWEKEAKCRKNCNNTLVLTALTTMGKYNVRAFYLYLEPNLLHGTNRITKSAIKFKVYITRSCQ